MCELNQLIANNQKWSADAIAEDQDFFQRLVDQQNPEYLWIGCSDSRVPANEIVGLAPGELFVHRNIANAVQATDLNCLSVLQYAVEVLKVKHVIVCGHYGCGGVAASMDNQEHGMVDNWLRQIKDVYATHRDELDGIEEQSARVNRLCELNVMEQVSNLAKTKTIQMAWQRNQPVTVHGWVYALNDGLVKDLKVSVSSIEQIDPLYRLEPTQRDSRPTIG